MKTKLLFYVLLCVTLFTFSQTTYVPDDNFEQALIDLGYDSGPLDDYVPTANIDTIISLDVADKNIADLTGIEDFLALTGLWCFNNQIATLDLQLNTALFYLICSGNQLTSLNVKNGNNANFTTFITYNNPSLLCIKVDNAAYSTANWTDIDATTSFSETCSAFYTYIPDDNFEQALIDLGYDTVLDDYVPTANINMVISLNVGSKNIADLTGIEAFTALSQLDCYNNSLTSLDLTQNTALTYLNCRSNNLTSLNVTQNTVLNTLYCYNNSLTSLDLTQNTVLAILFCYNNSLTNLDVSQNTALVTLYCYNNSLTSLDLTQNTALAILLCYNNSLASLNVKNGNNTNFTDFRAYGNPSLTCIEVDDVAYSTTNWTNIDAVASFSTSCPPPNNDCSNAIAVTCGNTVTGQTISATNSGGNLAPDVFYTFTGSGTTESITLSLCNGTNYDSYIRVFSDCTLTTELYGNDDSCGLYSELTFLSDGTTTYYIMIEGFSSSSGNFSLEVTCEPLTYIPDNNFEQALIDLGYDTVLDDYVPTVNINTITSLDVFSKNISELTGIEEFTALQVLNCYSNLLTSLDLTQNTALTFLDCWNNSLTTLDISANTALTSLYCNNNSLSTLNVANGNNTNFTAFNATNNPSLTCIEVDNVAYSTTNWTNIDVQTSFSTDCNACVVTIPDANFKAYLVGEAAINTNGDSEIQCSEASVFTGTINVDNLSISDLTGIEAFTALAYLYCNNNSLTSLDVSQNTALIRLFCYNNSLTSLDISQSTVLVTVHCYNNSLTTLNVANGNNSNITNTSFNTTNNPNLTCIDVDDVAYSTINWTNIDATASFSTDCSAACVVTIPDANFKAYLVGEAAINTNGDSEIQCNEASAFTGTINVSNLSISDLTGIEAFTALTNLYCYNNSLTSLDVSQNIALERLYCGDNQLTTLNVSNNVLLKRLECYANFQLASLDLTTNVALTNLKCYNTDIASLDLTTNILLQNLQTFSTELTSLDLSNNIALTYLSCDNNQITSLDLSAQTGLTFILCRNNALTSLNIKNGNNTNITTFDATINPSLTCIEVDDVAYADTNFTNIDAQTSFSTNCVYPIQLSAKAYLQGAATNPNTGEETWMRDDLRVASLIPTTSPYIDALTVNASVFTPTGANAIVDWVWVELRDKNDNTNVLASQSALLQRDGDIVATDGVSPISFSLSNGNYYVAISHRNHLGIMSSNTAALTTSTTFLDLSNGFASVNGGVNAVANLGNGIFALFAGDYDGNDQIQNTDVNSVVSLLGNSGYSNADTDLNGQTQNTDINILINPNIGKGQQYARQQLNLFAKRRTN